MQKNGTKSLKGVPQNRWGEPKDTNVNVTMTESGRRALRERITKTQTSLSEVFELWARRYPVDDDLTLVSSPPEPKNLDIILQSLSQLNGSELGKVARAVIDLLIQRGGQL